MTVLEIISFSPIDSFIFRLSLAQRLQKKVPGNPVMEPEKYSWFAWDMSA